MHTQSIAKRNVTSPRKVYKLFGNSRRGRYTSNRFVYLPLFAATVCTMLRYLSDVDN